MRKRIASILGTWPFLLCLGVLLANDWWLKSAHPSIATGKLSDFAGVSIITLLFLAAFPDRRRTVYAAVCLAFLWWKSPASQPFIAFINAFAPFHIGRVVDYSDLFALALLPVLGHVAAHHQRFVVADRRLFVIPITLATVFAITGTSSIPTRQEYDVRPSKAGDVLKRDEVAEVIGLVATKHGLTCRDCSNRSETATYTATSVTFTYVFVEDKSISFKFEAWAAPSSLDLAGWTRPILSVPPSSKHSLNVSVA
jgi:hypothetical protein